jgi:hypothetical protein
MPEALADVYLLPPNAGKSISYYTIPGKKLDFRGGYTRVFDPRELPWLLVRPDINLVPTARYADAVPTWCAQVPEHLKIQATITLPHGWWLDRRHQIHTEPRQNLECRGCGAELTVPYERDHAFCTNKCKKRYYQQRAAAADIQTIPEWRLPTEPEPAPVGG